MFSLGWQDGDPRLVPNSAEVDVERVCNVNLQKWQTAMLRPMGTVRVASRERYLNAAGSGLQVQVRSQSVTTQA